MKVVVLEMMMNPENAMAIPGTQSHVVEFDGNFEEYKELERSTAHADAGEDVEITGIQETLDNALVIDYVVRRHEKDMLIRQMHFIPYGLHGEK